jgi:hypothetical protein
VAALGLGAGLVISLAINEGCSSSSAPPPPADSGADGTTEPPVDAGPEAGTRCSPVFGGQCGAGQTCCISGIFGTCVDIGSCKAPIQVSCTSKASCGNQTCCGSVQLPAGFDAAAFDASDFDASVFDASGFSFSLACASSCPPPDFQLCAGAQDCPSGYRCGPGNGNGNGGMTSLPGFLVCVPEDAGLPPQSDAGGPRLDAGEPDASDASDGGAPADPDAADGG